MGGISSLISTVSLIDKGLSLVSSFGGSEIGARESAAAQEAAMRQLQRQQAENMRQAQENAALTRSQLALQSEAAERERRNALKRAVARQRANFGSQGTGSGAGSAQAVLLGLFEESEADLAEREKLDALRRSALDLDIAQQNRLNLIQREQLRENQKLSNLSRNFSRTANALDFGRGLIDLF